MNCPTRFYETCRRILICKKRLLLPGILAKIRLGLVLGERKPGSGKYLIVIFFQPRFWERGFPFLIAHFPDHCLLVPFHTVIFDRLLDDVMKNCSCILRDRTYLSLFVS